MRVVNVVTVMNLLDSLYNHVFYERLVENES